MIQFFLPGSRQEEDNLLYWTGQALASWGWLLSTGLSQSCPFHVHVLNALPEPGSRGREDAGVGETESRREMGY